MSGLRILRRPAVIEKTGLSESTIYLMLKEKKFPAPVQLGPRNVGWVESEVDDWLMDKIEARDTAAVIKEH